MKKLTVLACCLFVFVVFANAQKKPATRTAKKPTQQQLKLQQQKAADSLANVQRIADSTTNAVRVADSAKQMQQKLAQAGEIKMPVVKPSMRNPDAVDVVSTRERTPLVYDYVREDDAVFKQFNWRVIDIREKINLPFGYSADEDNGNQRFFNILLNIINPKAPRDPGDSAALSFSDDRFSEPKAFDQIAQLLVGKPTLTSIPDYAKDPDGSKNIMKDTIISNEFNPDDIIKFKLKEVVMFDKEASRMVTRVLGIAPILSKFDVDPITFEKKEREGGGVELFWVYYPDIRKNLTRYASYNPKNMAARLSWEDVFEGRFFSSYLVKTTMNNPGNKDLSAYIKDPLFRLLEGEKIKEKIFNYEQDLWSY
jgi:gliding motility associated protien GldN